MSGIRFLPIAIALLVRHYMKTVAANRVMNLILAVSVLTAAAATAIQLTGLAVGGAIMLYARKRR